MIVAAPLSAKDYRRALVVLAGLAALLLSGWLGGRVAERWALTDLRRSASSTLGLQVAALRAEMQAQSSLPLALAADPEIARIVAPAPDPELVEGVNGRLAQIAEATGAAVIYVMGTDGVTVAASNATSEKSFLGRDYGFRPYFRESMATGSGSQFALGTVSGRPGYYLARRLPRAAGVVVVKIEFDAIEAAWRTSRESVFVTDARGIVLVASDPAWRFKALRAIDDQYRGAVKTVVSNAYELEQAVLAADLVIGAVLVPGAKAPKLVSNSLVQRMKPGSVLVDIAIDQGGCFETSRPTTWKEPTYVEEGVTHFAVTNMPGAVPQTSSQAICAAILPWVNKLASGNDWRNNAALVKGINVEAGTIVHPALQDMKV